MSTRTIWTRGLTPNDYNKPIAVDGIQGTLKAVEHFDRGSVLTMLVEVDVPHDALVTIHE